MGRKGQRTTYSTTARKNSNHSSIIVVRPSRLHGSPSRGFTLVELLLVVVLLGVLAGVVFPRLRGSVRAAGLEEAADRVASVVRFARAESVRRGLKTRLTIDAAKNVLELELQKADPAGAESFEEFNDQFLDSDFILPAGVRLGKVRQGEQTLRATQIVFKPSGVSDPYTIDVYDNTDHSLIVEIGPWMDEVKIVKPEDAAKENSPES